MAPRTLPPSGRQLRPTAARRNHIKPLQASQTTVKPASHSQGVDHSKLLDECNRGEWKPPDQLRVFELRAILKDYGFKKISHANRAALVAQYKTLVALKNQKLQPNSSNKGLEITSAPITSPSGSNNQKLTNPRSTKKKQKAAEIFDDELKVRKKHRNRGNSHLEEPLENQSVSSRTVSTTDVPPSSPLDQVDDSTASGTLTSLRKPRNVCKVKQAVIKPSKISHNTVNHASTNLDSQSPDVSTNLTSQPPDSRSSKQNRTTTPPMNDKPTSSSDVLNTPPKTTNQDADVTLASLPSPKNVYRGKQAVRVRV
ncbi:hypothetical protein PSTG_17453 [Puccinia striiformis f. sp. tritici PST-78]|uniref:Uncharacterized protein n=1 Tax=Puccinia striiformis f. sp. tritici PST-78 TaxID=1165861 RepID=A0A0L0UPY7_9BASI|nr:hypothetical protein PSTG_17453 [Puccinia striiformis f. sp. tritici PST-78]